jgi:membrane fusion protein (multidrug efflux system)
MPSTPRRDASYPYIKQVVAVLATALLLAGCGKKEGAGQAQAGGPGGGPGGANEAPVPVAVAVAGSGDIASYYTATATLAAEKEATILSRVSGVVQKLLCEEGDVVREGAELLLVNNDEYRYRYEQAQAARMDLEAKVARLEKMREQELVSPEEFETLSNDLAAAQAAEGMAALNLSYTRVTAPFTGRVVARSVDVGQNINVGTQLFVLSDFTPLLARVHVPAKEFNKLQADQPVDLTLESNGTSLRGRIKLVSPVIDPSSGTIKVTIEIPTYPPGVRPGDFAQVSIVTERRVNCTLVPKVALVNDRGEQVVYVSADSTAERRVVEIGFQDDRNAEILTGVTEGERVVVKGQRTLKNGAAIKILDNTEAAQVTDSAVTRDGS